jgi:hypothetical protein
VISSVFALGLVINAFPSAHYIAPLTGALYIFMLQLMRHLRLWRPGGQTSGLLLVRALTLVCVILAAVRLSAHPLHLYIGRWPEAATWFGHEPTEKARANLQARLETFQGGQLAVVRYSPDHSSFKDWVYNAADIDHSKVVWAREMDPASDAELLRYFSDRTAWLVEPDANPPRLSPYPAEQLKSAGDAGARLQSSVLNTGSRLRITQ